MIRLVLLLSLQVIKSLGSPINCALPASYTGTFRSATGQLKFDATGSITGQEGGREVQLQCYKIAQDRPDVPEMFLFQNNQENCRQCVIFLQDHNSWLQWKRSWCFDVGTDDQICNDLSHRNYEHLFKNGAKPAPSQLPSGAFNFTYTTVHGSCSSQTSLGVTHIDSSRFRLSYRTCPDMTSEAKVEEYQTYGSSIARNQPPGINNKRFLTAKLLQPKPKKGENPYRCMNIETTSEVSGKLEISMDATCAELLDSMPALKLDYTFTSLFPDPGAIDCSFPYYAKKEWLTLTNSGDRTVHISEYMMELRTDGVLTGRAQCIEQRSGHLFVVFEQDDYNYGYRCVRLLSHDPQFASNVLEMQRGPRTESPEDACDLFDEEQTPYETFLAANAKPRRCPLQGHYVRACSPTGDTRVSFGCRSAQEFVIDYGCAAEDLGTYACYGDWSDGTTDYLVARSLKTNHPVCFSHTSERDQEELLLRSYNHRSCVRGIFPASQASLHVEFNVSISEDICSRAVFHARIPIHLIAMLLLWLLCQ